MALVLAIGQREVQEVPGHGAALLGLFAVGAAALTGAAVGAAIQRRESH